MLLTYASALAASGDRPRALQVVQKAADQARENNDPITQRKAQAMLRDLQ